MLRYLYARTLRDAVKFQRWKSEVPFPIPLLQLSAVHTMVVLTSLPHGQASGGRASSCTVIISHLILVQNLPRLDYRATADNC